MKLLVNVIFEDDEILVINKPADLVCHPTKGDEYSSLISRIRMYLGAKKTRHLINRLDRETSGLIVVAKKDEAAREIRKLWEQRLVRKEYLAIVLGKLKISTFTIDAPLGRDEKSKVAIKDCVRSDGSSAKTDVSVLKSFSKARKTFSLVRAVPLTGRKHQIRIHLAHAGNPIVGDKLYAGDEDIYLSFVEDRLTPEQSKALILPHHALHAERLQFEWRGRKHEFKAEPEEWFREFADI